MKISKISDKFLLINNHVLISLGHKYNFEQDTFKLIVKLETSAFAIHVNILILNHCNGKLENQQEKFSIRRKYFYIIYMRCKLSYIAHTKKYTMRLKLYADKAGNHRKTKIK